MSKRAEGGEVKPSENSDGMFVLSEGVAVVPDAAMERYGRGMFARLNGGGHVFSVSEVAAAYDED